MKVVTLLADSAQVCTNKLFVLGGGISIIPANHSFAIVVKIDLPWNEANRKHLLKMELKNSDGLPVLIPTSVGDRPAEITTEFESGRPPGLAGGTPLDVPLALIVPPLPLPPGRYEWVVTIDGQGNEDWNMPFSVVNRRSQ